MNNNVDQSDYKSAKEAFVSELTGGSIIEINLVSLTALTSYLFWAVLKNRQFLISIEDEIMKSKRIKRIQNFKLFFYSWLIEILILVLPIVLACTILSNKLIELNGILLSASGITFFSKFSSNDFIKSKKLPKKHWSKYSDDEEEEDEERERLELMNLNNNNDNFNHFNHYNHQEQEEEEDLLSNDRIRVSIESAGESANASASPHSPFVAPGQELLIENEIYNRNLNSNKNSNSNSNSLIEKSFINSFKNKKSLISKSVNSKNSISKSVISRSVNSKNSISNDFISSNQPFLTIYRSHMMLITIICILAIDFKIFPRQFGKCEFFGTSLMDLGVGSFVFSFGIISALSILQNSSSFSIKNQSFSFKFQLKKDFKRSFPLLLIGLIRIFFIKILNYPEHISEYGIHWNFFLTLAILSIFKTLFKPLTRFIRFSTLGILIGLFHQSLLEFTFLKSIALDNNVERNNFFLKNKEGLISLPGYLSIYFLGLDLGHYILPKDPYFAYRKSSNKIRKINNNNNEIKTKQMEKTENLIMILSSYSIIYWFLFYFLKLILQFKVSRRLANFSYIIWITSFNTLFILAYCFIYMILLQNNDLNLNNGNFKKQDIIKGKQRNSIDQQEQEREEEQEEEDILVPTSTTTSSQSPEILESLNKNSFIIFLIANLLTGLINISIKTMYVNSLTAFSTLIFYICTCLFISTLISIKGWKLKFTR